MKLHIARVRRVSYKKKPVFRMTRAPTRASQQHKPVSGCVRMLWNPRQTDLRGCRASERASGLAGSRRTNPGAHDSFTKNAMKVQTSGPLALVRHSSAGARLRRSSCQCPPQFFRCASRARSWRWALPIPRREMWCMVLVVTSNLVLVSSD